MSITHELREWISSVTWLNDGIHHTCDKITAIADRIDAEHEDAVRKEAARMLTKTSEYMNDDDLAEIGLVRLPKDADGEYIRIGDVMEWVRYKDDDPTVVRIVSALGNGVFFAWSDEHGRYAQYKANAYRHHHAPTVEDVLREFALAVCKDDALTIRKDVLDEYAAKLRLAGDAE